MLFIFKGLVKQVTANIRSLLKKQDLSYLDDQDLTRFCDHDIILTNEDEVKRVLPDVLGQALARAWVDKRFLEAFVNHPVEILERGGVYLPSFIKIVFEKEEQTRPKVTIYRIMDDKMKKVLELKLILVAER
jgi:hypothetical protein